MKKYVAVLALTSLLLTGCGNAAGTAEGSTPAADASPKAAEESNSVEPQKESEATVEPEFYNWSGIDMPIPLGMERPPLASDRSMWLWQGGTDDAPVYFAFGSIYETLDKTEDQALEKAADAMWVKLNKQIELFYLSNSDTSKKNVDSTKEVTFFDRSALREEGTIVTEYDEKFNYVAYYAFLDFSESGETDLPSLWMAFTPSDDKNAIELMNQAADAPLTDAKLHQ